MITIIIELSEGGGALMNEDLIQQEKIREAKRLYMRQYRKTPSGRTAIKKANDRYWEKKFDELAEEFRTLKDKQQSIKGIPGYVYRPQFI